MVTDKEIIKALKICSSEHLGCEDGCPYLPTKCGTDVLKDALDLINRQQAEIESLTEKIEAMGDPLEKAQYKIAEQQAEIERLKDIAKGALNESINICDSILDAKAEAIKEYAWRFEKKIETSPYMSVALKYTMLKNAKQIKDNLLKEMVGDAE